MVKIIIGTILIILGIGAFFGISLGNFIFALILIAIGVKIISGNEHNSVFKTENSITNEDFINEISIFSFLNKKNTSENFKGGKILMIFSGGKIDISQIKTSEKNIDIEIFVLFGGGELIVPKNWKINSQGTSIFGGYDSRVEGEGTENILNIKGVAIFGGIKIVN